MAACASWSAWIGSTTPRAFRAGSWRTSGCCTPIPSCGRGCGCIQVAVPSRTGVGAYQDFRTLVDELVGRINGAFGTPRWVPVHYIFRGLSESELVALYRAADVMLVTPLRDGMNLVAKEFVASRIDGDGVLVLSEFAGAAWELPEALRVNPYDVEGAAEVYYRALTMPRRGAPGPARAAPEPGADLRRPPVGGVLPRASSRSPRRSCRRGGCRPGREAAREALTRRLAETDALLLLLDYDGTLVPFAATPELARPDAGLVALLGAIAARPDTEVHVVSGRAREALDHWLGHLPVWLHAEHGFWSRAPRLAGVGPRRRARRKLARAGPGHSPGHHRAHARIAHRGEGGGDRVALSAWPIPRPARAGPTSCACISTRY